MGGRGASSRTRSSFSIDDTLFRATNIEGDAPWNVPVVNDAIVREWLPTDYEPWQNDLIDSITLDKVIAGWKGSSSDVRHAINERTSSSLDKVTAQKFDDWVNSGTFKDTLYRGKRITDEELSRLKPGAVINQDGPASFSKNSKVAMDFANGGYNGNVKANKRAIFVLDGGTKAGRDIQNIHGFHGEQEVIVGSASHMVIHKVTTEVINGHHYTFVYGREAKQKYISKHKKG